MGNIEITTKLSRLKIVSSIDDDYLKISLKMFIEIRLWNRMTYVFKDCVKIVQIYMVKFNVSILNWIKTMFFCKYKVLYIVLVIQLSLILGNTSMCISEN